MLVGADCCGQPFGDIDPTGQVVRIKRVPFTVIGACAWEGQPSRTGQDQDDTIFVTVTAAQKKSGTQFPGMVRIIHVKAKSTEDLAAAEKQINELLRQRHRIGPK